MLLGERVNDRRVFVLGVAGLVPAALVTLFLVHQPSIGERRLYPMLRGSLAVAGLGLAAATLLTWATAPNRLSRTSLSGLAWAGVAVLLCIGPLLESTPRARLYGLDLATGRVVWDRSGPVGEPRLVDGDLVVTDAGARQLIGLAPASGRERWRRPIDGDDVLPTTATDGDIHVVDGHVEATGDGEAWSLPFPGEQVLDVTQAGSNAYAYVSTPGAAGAPGGAVVRIDADDGRVLWRRSLPATVAASTGTPAIAASSDAVVVAGGERVAVLDADSGRVRWTQSVVTLGKSRGYALPGAVQQVIVTDSLVFLSATSD